MKKIHIVTDSTADLHSTKIQDKKIKVVPLTVNFSDKSYSDGVDLLPDAFFAKLIEADKLPTTSQVSVGNFVEAYKSLAKDTDIIISLHISGKMSGTYQAAVLAAEEVPNVEIIPIDSQTVSCGLGHLVMEAADLVQAGYSMEDILVRIKQVRDLQEVYFSAGTLEFLAKGGRIGKAQAIAGSILNIKPILTIDQEGFVAPYEKIRGSKKILARLEELFANYIAKHGPKSRVTVVHSANIDEAKRFKELIREKYGIEEIAIASVGPVVGTHLGPGALGLALTLR